MEQVCRTNLFKFPNVAVNKNHVFRALMDSMFGSLLCVFLICHKEALVWILAHLEKVSNSNLFEFSVSGIIGKFQFNKAFGFSSTKLCQNIYVACSNKLKHPTTFVFKLARLEKHLKRFWLSIEECPFFPLNLFGNFYKVCTSSFILNLEIPPTSWKLTR